MIPFLAQAGSNVEVGTGSAATALVVVIGGMLKSWWSAYAKDKRDAKTDSDQTAIFRQIANEQVRTRIALESSTMVGNERYSMLKTIRDIQHGETVKKLDQILEKLPEKP